MNSFEDLEKKLNDIKRQTPPETDQRILEDAVSEFQRANKVRQTVFYIGPIFKAVAAVIVIAVIASAAILFFNDRGKKTQPIVKDIQKQTSPKRQRQDDNLSDTPKKRAEVPRKEDSTLKLKKDLAKVTALIQAEDVNGLLAALEDIELPAQMLAANYLAKTGNERVAEILAQMGEKHFPDDPNNFFEKAAENIFAQYKDVVEEVNDINEIGVKTVLDEPCDIAVEPNLIFYILSGYLLNEINEPLSSADLDVIAGQVRLETKSDSNGWYEITKVPGDVNLTIIPFKDGYGYNPFSFDPIDSNTSLDIQIFPQAYDWYNKAAPELIVQQWLNCEPISLADFKGNYILLYLGLSQHEADSYKHLIELNKRYYDFNDLTIIGVHEYLNSDTEINSLLNLIESEHIDIPLAIDASMDLAKGIVLEDEKYFDGVKLVYKRRGIRSGGATHSIYEVRQRPTYYLIDPNGVLQKCIGQSEIQKNLAEF